MDYKDFLRAVGIKTSRRFRVGTKGLLKSYISIFLVLVLILSTTVAWFTVNDQAGVDSDNFLLESASSMRTNKGLQISNNIVINNFKLDEATSMDGRNMFFPTTGSFSAETAQMKFREGNVGDRNVRYVYKDFTLSSGSGKTDVFVKGYTITIGDAVYKDEIEIQYNASNKPILQIFPPDCPLRIAFIADSAKEPVIIDPAARVKSFAKNTDAVETIDTSGTPTTQTTDLDSFSSYYYPNGKPLYVIENNEKLNCTMVVWLEGTTGDCDQYVGKTMSIDVDIESNFEDFETITFLDDTIGDDDTSVTHWIGTDTILAMQYLDPDEDMYGVRRYKTVIMKYIDTVDGCPRYQGAIKASAVTNISFFRLNNTATADVRKDTIFNSWHTKPLVNDMLTDRAKEWREKQVAQPYVNGEYQTGDNKKLLQESREVQKGDEVIRSIVYTARHGNGYGSVNHSADDRYEKWLSPCVGYWEYAAEDGGSSGGQQEATSYQVNISLNTNDFSYIESQASLSGAEQAKIYIRLVKPDNSTEDVLMNHKGSNRFTKDGYTVQKNTRIQSFVLKYGNNTNANEEWMVSGGYTFTKSDNPTFNLKSPSGTKIAVKQ